jgi:hypothetical protein
MNNLSSRQRKLVYGAVIVLLMIPIIVLGQPATRTDSGGELAKLRAQYKLGETSLGEIDPSSATMNLMLLGLRGIATDLLWIQAIEEKKTKNWGQLKTTVHSITLLQPHYIKVWDFQGWNLAYNVSVEWDAVPDRYYWVKEGAKFLQKGIDRNQDEPELPYRKGIIIGQKIGRADEWRYFRRYFKVDPDPTVWKSPGVPGPDPELNPFGQDNYMVAKELYQEANEKEAKPGVEQHIEARYLFRSKPARSQIDLAMAYQREGIFEDYAHQEWEQAYRDWTEVFGQEFFAIRGVFNNKNFSVQVRMDSSLEDLQKLAAEQGVPVAVLARGHMTMQNVVNYRYWKRRADAERRGETEEAHRLFFEAEKAFYADGPTPKALALVEQALKKYEFAFNAYFQEIKGDTTAIEEGIRGVLLLQYIHRLQGTPMPNLLDKFGPTINNLWLQNPGLIPEIEREMQRQQERKTD